MSRKLEKLELRQLIHGKPQNLYVQAMFDPNSLEEASQFKHVTTTGSESLQVQYITHPPPLLSFTFILDGTGVNQPDGAVAMSVSELVEKIRKITQGYNGSSHEMPLVALTWGANVVRGRTTKLDIEYTLFKSTGEPLRANVTLEIVRLPPRAVERKTKNMESPDLTHTVSVKGDDILPLLCCREYCNASYYL
ncbi:MAG: hypothetical protein AAF404_04610, partial [Pseudomonadota bacterium]